MTLQDHGGVIGDFRHGLFIGIDFNTCWRSYRIPQAAYAIFQLMFAAITSVESPFHLALSRGVGGWWGVW